MATYNLFTTTPAISADIDDSSVSLGTEFYVTADGWVTHIRYLQPSTGGNTNTRQAAIYSTTNGTSGSMVAGPFNMPAPTAGQWCTFGLPTPLKLTPNTRYRVTVRHPAGRYAATSQYFTTGAGSVTRVDGILVVPNDDDALASAQGSYLYSGSIGFPSSTFQGGAYYSDVTITDVDPAGPTPNTGTATTTIARTSAAAGERQPKGAASTTITRTSSAAGKRNPKGTASTTVTRSSAATGKRNPKGSASSTITRSSAAAGERQPKGNTSSTITWTTSAAGVAPNPDTNTGSTSTSITRASSATGKRTPKGSTSSTITWTTSSAGQRQPKGRTSTTITRTTSAAGEAPTIGQHNGTATTTITRTTSSAGQRQPKGTTSSTITRSSTAAGVAPLDPNAFVDIHLEVHGPTGHPLLPATPAGHPLQPGSPAGYTLTMEGPRP